MKKTVFFVFIGILAITIFSFLFRNQIIQKGLSYYVASRLDVSCKIGAVSVTAAGLRVDNLSMQNNNFSLVVEHAQIAFPRNHVLPVTVNGAQIAIDDVARSQQQLRQLALPPKHDSTDTGDTDEALCLRLALHDIAFSVKEKASYQLTTTFSFEGDVTGQALTGLRGMSVEAFSLRSGPLALAFRLIEEGDSEYALHIDSIKHGDKKIANITLPLQIYPQGVHIEEGPIAFFGPAAFLEGSLDMTDFNSFCLRLRLRQASFQSVGELLGPERDIYFNGPFDGECRVCWDKGKFSLVKGELAATAGGVINIQKEYSFDFLKKYLDDRSMKALVDSFNNYAYNGGRISISSQADMISLHFDFNSVASGRRDITVNYYFTGGEQG